MLPLYTVHSSFYCAYTRIRVADRNTITKLGLRLSRQELGAAGECSGIRRMGGCCGAPYSLWPLGRAGLLRIRMGGHCRWEKPGSSSIPSVFQHYIVIPCSTDSVSGRQLHHIERNVVHDSSRHPNAMAFNTSDTK